MWYSIEKWSGLLLKFFVFDYKDEFYLDIVKIIVL